MAKKTEEKEVDPLTAASVKETTKNEAASAAEKSAVSEKVKVAEAAPPAESKISREIYVVERKVTISWGSQMLNLQQGKEISEASHGRGCIAKLENMGVALKKK